MIKAANPGLLADFLYEKFLEHKTISGVSEKDIALDFTLRMKQFGYEYSQEDAERFVAACQQRMNTTVLV